MSRPIKIKPTSLRKRKTTKVEAPAQTPSLAQTAHEFLLMIGLTDGYKMPDVVVDNKGNLYDITRHLTITERLTALRAAAPYFAAQKKSVENSTQINMVAETTEELKARALKLLKK